ncbi:hypothetical protein DOTSEDRAFT_80177 [Dothistroma septosporum NZE10]|uniref:Uncharacterized protein n=1 Tax=Dothistroma septosporum (strain NZE10 / CBS 128990) TaxID=675120 RepID=N1PNG1_DOTSN|nr:hypothetical protein DOTSEDRAFT_80177 [Dothistroma septosporum NZE10]
MFEAVERPHKRFQSDSFSLFPLHTAFTPELRSHYAHFHLELAHTTHTHTHGLQQAAFDNLHLLERDLPSSTSSKPSHPTQTLRPQLLTFSHLSTINTTASKAFLQAQTAYDKLNTCVQCFVLRFAQYIRPKWQPFSACRSYHNAATTAACGQYSCTSSPRRTNDKRPGSSRRVAPTACLLNINRRGFDRVVVRKMIASCLEDAIAKKSGKQIWLRKRLDRIHSQIADRKRQIEEDEEEESDSESESENEQGVEGVEVVDAIEATEQFDAICAAEKQTAVDEDDFALFGLQSPEHESKADSGYAAVHFNVVDDSDCDSLFGEPLDDDDNLESEAADDDDALEAALTAAFVEMDAEEDAQECEERLEEVNDEGSSFEQPDQPHVLDGDVPAILVVPARQIVRSDAQPAAISGQKRKRRDSVSEAPAPKQAKLSVVAVLDDATVREQHRSGTLRKANRLPVVKEWLKRSSVRGQSYLTTWPKIEAALTTHFDRLDADERSKALAKRQQEIADLNDDDSEATSPAERLKSNAASPAVPFISFGAAARESASWRGAVAKERDLAVRFGRNWRDIERAKLRETHHKMSASSIGASQA